MFLAPTLAISGVASWATTDFSCFFLVFVLYPWPMSLHAPPGLRVPRQVAVSIDFPSVGTIRFSCHLLGDGAQIHVECPALVEPHVLLACLSALQQHIRAMTDDIDSAPSIEAL